MKKYYIEGDKIKELSIIRYLDTEREYKLHDTLEDAEKALRNRDLYYEIKGLEELIRGKEIFNDFSDSSLKEIKDLEKELKELYNSFEK